MSRNHCPRIKADLQSEILLQKKFFDGDLVKSQILPLPENFLIHETGTGPIGGEAAAGAIIHSIGGPGVSRGSGGAEIEFFD
jgi:hypothetical protein